MFEKPNYWGLIPADVRYDSRLSPAAKVIYCEITALSNFHGFCWATNEFLGKLYVDITGEESPEELIKKLNSAKVKVSRWIKNLRDFSYIKAIYIHNQDNTKERRIYTHMTAQFHKIKDGQSWSYKKSPVDLLGVINKNVNDPSLTKMLITPPVVNNFVNDVVNKNVNNPGGVVNKNVKNNININNTRDIEINTPGAQEPTNGGKNPLIKKILEDFNSKSGKAYSVYNIKRLTIDYMIQWLNEGYSLEQFQKVNTIKSQPNKFNNEKMDHCLNPDVLYGLNFKNYVQERLPKEFEPDGKKGKQKQYTQHPETKKLPVIPKKMFQNKRSEK